MKQLFSAILAICLCFFGASAKVDTLEVKSPLIEDPMRITVITPDSPGEEAYPTVYLLNGYSGDYRSWCQIRPDLDSLATAYGMIFVCPDGMDSWYWDSPADPKMQMESFITKELVPMIDDKYPTIPDPQQRAVTGLSMGGHGGLWLGMRHPEIFGSAGSTSGGVNIIPFTSKWKMEQRLGSYQDNKELWEEHTVINLVPQLEPGQLNIIFDCGTEDFFAQVNEQLHQALLEKGIPHDYISRPGNHSSAYWSNSILYQILYFHEVFLKNKR